MDCSLRLFDVERRQVISSLQSDTAFTLLPKASRELYVAKKGSIFGVDWRKKDYLVGLATLFRDQPESCYWMSDPFSKNTWC